MNYLCVDISYSLQKDGALDYKFGNLNSDPESELISFLRP